MSYSEIKKKLRQPDNLTSLLQVSEILILHKFNKQLLDFNNMLFIGQHANCKSMSKIVALLIGVAFYLTPSIHFN